MSSDAATSQEACDADTASRAKLVLTGQCLVTVRSQLAVPKLYSTLVHLDLSRNSIGVLPPEIGNFSLLEHLDVSRNHLRELPVELGRLAKLRKLVLLSNKFRSVFGSLLPVFVHQSGAEVRDDVLYNHAVAAAKQYDAAVAPQKVKHKKGKSKLKSTVTSDQSTAGGKQSIEHPEAPPERKVPRLQQRDSTAPPLPDQDTTSPQHSDAENCFLSSSLPALQVLDLRFNKKIRGRAGAVLAAVLPQHVEVLVTNVAPLVGPGRGGDESTVGIVGAHACDRDATLLRSQLEPYGTPFLLNRLQRDFGLNAPTGHRAVIMEKLLDAYKAKLQSPTFKSSAGETDTAGRRIRRVAGTKVSEDLCSALLRELEDTEWVRTSCLAIDAEAPAHHHRPALHPSCCVPCRSPEHSANAPPSEPRATLF